MSDTYISRKLDQINQNDLKEKVFARFSLLQNKQEINDFTSTLSQLNEEISKTYPLIDYEYAKEINSSLNEISNDYTKKEQVNIKTELKISSENNLNYLMQVINVENKPYLFENLNT